MLITTEGVTKKRKILVLEQRHAQVLLDLEPFLMNLGLGVEIRCISCLLAGRPVKDAVIKGGYDHESSTFSMMCACTERVYSGRDLIWPKPPTWSALAKDRIAIQRDVPLNNWHVSRCDDIDRVLTLLRLSYRFNCLQCASDGLSGDTGGSLELELTIECQCAKRTYSPHAAPVQVH